MTVAVGERVINSGGEDDRNEYGSDSNDAC